MENTTDAEIIERLMQLKLLSRKQMCCGNMRLQTASRKMDRHIWFVRIIRFVDHIITITHRMCHGTKQKSTKGDSLKDRKRESPSLCSPSPSPFIHPSVSRYGQSPGLIMSGPKMDHPGLISQGHISGVWDR